MAFRLDPRRAAAKQVRSRLCDECDAALRAARIGDDDAVHAIRRHGKRSRALLRLAQGMMSKRERRRIAHAWRDIGRLLAPLRDHRALSDGLVAVRRRYPERLAALALPAPRAPAGRARIVRQARAALTRLRQRLATLRPHGGWRAVSRGHVRALVACAKAWTDAVDSDDHELRHTWRKRVKDAAHQTHLLARLASGLLDHLEGAWDRLGDALGAEQDAVLLARWLEPRHDHAALAYRQATLTWLTHLRRRTARATRGLPPARHLMRLVLRRGRRLA